MIGKSVRSHMYCIGHRVYIVCIRVVSLLSIATLRRVLLFVTCQVRAGDDVYLVGVANERFLVSGFPPNCFIISQSTKILSD